MFMEINLRKYLRTFIFVAVAIDLIVHHIGEILRPGGLSATPLNADINITGKRRDREH